MRLTICARKAYGRTDHFIREEEPARLLQALRGGRKTVGKDEVEILEKLGFECVMPDCVVVFKYKGPAPTPARLYWDPEYQ